MVFLLKLTQNSEFDKIKSAKLKNALKVAKDYM